MFDMTLVAAEAVGRYRLGGARYGVRERESTISLKTTFLWRNVAGFPAPFAAYPDGSANDLIARLSEVSVRTVYCQFVRASCHCN